MTRNGVQCHLSAAQMEKRGLAWIVGAFALCPCHLPLTLAFIAALLSGTAAGALITRHSYISGGAIALVWLALTLRGFRYLRSARRVRKPGY